MKKLYKPIASILFLILALSSLASVIYAWFLADRRIFDVEFESAYVDMSLYLFKVQDYDRNGIPDLFFNGEDYEEILVDISSAKHIFIDNMLPSQILTYKIILENNSEIDCEAKLNISGLTGNLKDVLSIEAYSAENSAMQEIHGEKIFLAGKHNVLIIDEIPVNSKESASIYIKIAFESLQSLQAQSLFLGYSDLNDFVEQTFSLSSINVILKTLSN